MNYLTDNRPISPIISTLNRAQTDRYPPKTNKNVLNSIYSPRNR